MYALAREYYLGVLPTCKSSALLLHFLAATAQAGASWRRNLLWVKQLEREVL